MVFFNVAALLSSESDGAPLERARFRGGESWTGEVARLEDPPLVLARGFVVFVGAGLVVPLAAGRGAALAGAVGPTEVALVDRRRGGWLDMTELVQVKHKTRTRMVSIISRDHIAFVALREHSHKQAWSVFVTTSWPFSFRIQEYRKSDSIKCIAKSTYSIGSTYVTRLQEKRFARSSAFRILFLLLT